MRFSARAFLAALLVLTSPVPALVPPAAAASGKGSIRIGLLNPRDATLGGYDVELRTGDEDAPVENAVAVARRLVATDGVDAIVGVLHSSDALAIADALDAGRTPLVVAGASYDDLTQTDAHRALLRVARTSSQDAMPLGDFVCRRLGKRTAAIVAIDNVFGAESSGGFARAYTDAGCRIVQEQYGAEGSDWGDLVAKVDRAASVVFASVGGIDAVAFLAAYRASGTKAPLVGDGLLTDERVLGDERESARGVVTGLHYAATLDLPENKSFRLGYESLGGKPVSQFVENGYVAAAVLSAALDRVPAGPGGQARGDAIAAALRAVQITVPRGNVRFDGFGQIVNDVYIRRVVQVGGRYRNDVIATYPSVSQFWRYDPKRYLQLPSYEKLKGTWSHERTALAARRPSAG
jgi:branched-chain amino acid transport system substrate-binding protein